MGYNKLWYGVFNIPHNVKSHYEEKINSLMGMCVGMLYTWHLCHIMRKTAQSDGDVVLQCCIHGTLSLRVL